MRFPTCRHRIPVRFSDGQLRYDKPSDFYFTLLSCVLGIRTFLLRYLSPPRPSFLRLQELERPGPDGRTSLRIWEGAPYYVRLTFWRRWGPGAWASRLLGLPVPGDEGDKYWPRGYTIPEIGPEIMAGKGVRIAKETVAGLQKTRTGGCPFVRGEAG